MQKQVLKLLQLWDKFWFANESAYTFGIFRIFFGIYILVLLVVGFHNLEYYFGPTGIFPVYPLPFPFDFIGPFLNNDIALWVLYWIAFLATTFFIVGFKTRTATIILYLIFLYLFFRNPFIISGQDGVNLILLFLSCFAPLGNSFSLDQVLQKYKFYKDNSGGYRPKLYSTWSGLLFQISIALIYLFTGIDKILSDSAWRDGTAIYYLSFFDHWFRFANVYLLHNVVVSKVLTYGTLALELSFPFLIWFRRTRFLLLLGVIGMHIGMMVLMTSIITFFGLAMICGLILFIPPETMKGFLQNIKPHKVVKLFYDGDCNFCGKVKNLILAFGDEKLLHTYNLRDPKTYQQFPDLNEEQLAKEIHLLTPEGEYKKGFYAFQYLTTSMPGLIILAPLFYFPGISFFGEKIYQWVADHRSKYFGCESCRLSPTKACPIHS